MNIINEGVAEREAFFTRLKFKVKNAINHIQLNYSRRIREAFVAG